MRVMSTWCGDMVQVINITLYSNISKEVTFASISTTTGKENAFYCFNNLSFKIKMLLESIKRVLHL